MQIWQTTCELGCGSLNKIPPQENMMLLNFAEEEKIPWKVLFFTYFDFHDQTYFNNASIKPISE